MYLYNEDTIKKILLWEKCIKKYNPGIDILMIDSGSDPILLNRLKQDNLTVDGIQMEIIRLDKNYGHACGWMKSFILGLVIAKQRNHDYAVFIEYDMFTKLNIKEIINYMQKNDINILCPKSEKYSAKFGIWIETALMFFNLNYITNEIIQIFNSKENQEDLWVEGFLNDLLKPKIANWYGDRDEDDQIDFNKAVYITHTQKNLEKF